MTVAAVVGRFGLWMRVPMLMLLFGSIVLLPFETRPSPVPTSDRLERWLERLGLLGNLVLPGSIWLARRRLWLGCLAAPVGPFLWLLEWLGRKGGLFSQISFPKVSPPQLFGEMSAQDVLVSPAMQSIGAVAGVLFWLVYGAAFLYTARRVVQAVRSSRAR